ncbi:hypothetical protein DYBT9623_03738 [Dyadobacter sp. CECT 9623]|uniref:DUF4153 domain-containing protein n=1 Tax=Dyadobacter linearis TaxID=2823330 RepID=A0ABN7RCU1_9BACT|nr:DUF4153 domain-containing protein [Dyadobacter sp. CECT 9623]CAG5071747.1 hypothetical protein DYBT9623_03738 [Dyadobacter sp. CECT 9623]
MIKLPSLHHISDQLTNTIRRFPWVVAVAICKAAVLWRYLESTGNEEEINLMTRLAYPLFLATPLMIAIELIVERKQLKASWIIGINLLVSAILTLYFFTIPDEPTPRDYYRFMLFMVASHLLVAFSPFLSSGQTNGFWQFNKTLFLQSLNATLYAVTLYVGLLIAVKTVEYLFDITYLIKIEGDLFVLIAVVFHTLFFLSKIPVNLIELDEETSYPAGLKIFTQYVLLPLEVVYMVILYAYTFKIIFQWKLPDGGVAYLIMAFSIAGILALLLLHPLREMAREKWVRLFGKRFYLALLPLIVLLFIGIFRRINDYGVTENRYIIAVLAFWLAVITIYFLVSKMADIRWIPISLSVIALLLAIGPWNIFVVARNSQLRTFEKILTENKLLNANRQISGKVSVRSQDYQQLESIIQFFRSRKQKGLEKYFPGLKMKYGTGYQHYEQMDQILAEHVVNKPDNFRFNPNYVNYSSRSAESDSITVPIAGFNRLKFFALNNITDLKTDPYGIDLSAKGRFMNLYKNGNKVQTWDLSEKIRALKSSYGISSEKVKASEMVLKYTTPSDDLIIIFSSINQSGDYYSGEAVLVFK